MSEKIIVPYLGRNQQQPINLEFTKDDFVPSRVTDDSKKFNKPKLYEFFRPSNWPDDIYGTADVTRWQNFIIAHATTYQEFAHVFRTELDTLFTHVLKTKPENRDPNSDQWFGRTYFPKDQKGDKPKERPQTFAAFLYKSLRRKIGLPVVPTSTHKKFNADGTPWVSLQERLNACGMGYFGDCKQSDLVIMYEEARDILGQNDIDVITPGMVMAKVFEMENEGKYADDEIQDEIYQDRLNRYKDGDGTNAAYMSALMYAADRLGELNKPATGKVVGGKSEANNKTKPKDFSLQGREGLHFRRKQFKPNYEGFAKDIEDRNQARNKKKLKRSMALRERLNQIAQS